MPILKRFDHDIDQSAGPLNRRRLLQIAAGGAVAGLILPGEAMAATHRGLSFHNLHTGERLKTVYWEQGHYVSGALDEINTILRDFRTGDVTEMDTGLIDLLYTLRRTMATDAPFEIISGYRSPKTNAMLARASSGVAKRSLHMRGMAADIRLPGRELSALRRAARRLKAGGVGYYPKSNFIHVDVGRVRYW